MEDGTVKSRNTDRSSPWLGLGLTILGVTLISACASSSLVGCNMREDDIGTIQFTSRLHRIWKNAPEYAVQLFIPILIGCMVHWVALQLYLHNA